MQVFDGEEGLEAESGVYDLILFDLMLPEKMDSKSLKELREKGITTPVLIMTAKESLDDKDMVLSWERMTTHQTFLSRRTQNADSSPSQTFR